MRLGKFIYWKGVIVGVAVGMIGFCHRLAGAVEPGIMTTLAGTGISGYSGDAGRAVEAKLHHPTDVAVDAAGNLYIADSYNNRIRYLNRATGFISTFAGSGVAGFAGDGDLATDAHLNYPVGVALDGNGDLFIADNENHRIRRVDHVSGIITTVAGTGTGLFSGDGGLATNAGLVEPADIFIDKDENVFIADNGSRRVRRIDYLTGKIATVAGSGSGTFTGDNISATTEGMSPTSIYVDDTGALFIADFNNNRVRRVDAVTGIITTVAGNGLDQSSGDGGLAVASSLAPWGLVADSTGTLFISDFKGSRVRRLDRATGILTTVAGNGWDEFSGDGGAATAAGLNLPVGLALDSFGNILVADELNFRVREINFLPVPTITTIAPASGSMVGGTTVTITGTHFLSSASVIVGGALAPSVSGNATTLVVLTPAGIVGSTDVIVINPDYQRAIRPNGFTFILPAPSIMSITPPSGPTSGNTTVTITGENFSSSATVKFGSALATPVSWSPSTLVVLTPAGALGVTGVVVTNADNQSATSSHGFTYEEIPQQSNATQGINVFNPDNGGFGEIRYQLDSDDHVSIIIYDRHGGEVLTLINDTRSAGANVETWDGRNSSGATVASGYYNVVIKFGGTIGKRKVVVLK